MTEIPNTIPSRKGNNSKCLVSSLDYAQFLQFQFLPNDITFSKATVWHLPDVPGRENVMAQYIAGGMRTVGFSIELRSLNTDYVEQFLEQFKAITEGKEFFLILSHNQMYRCVITEGFSVDGVMYTMLPGKTKYGNGSIGQAKIKVNCVILEDLSTRGF